MRLFLFSVALVLLAPVSHAALERQIIGSEQDHSIEAEATDCEHFYKTTFTNFDATVNDQEQREIPMVGVEPQLKVIATAEGGVSIRGWSRPYARLIVCRFAVANNRAQAMRVLGGINVSHANGKIEALGPAIDSTQAWWVNMILYVPRRANVDVRAAHGGVAIRNMGGRVKAHATTGGISVVQSTGRYLISTESGGITLDRITGRVEAASQQGSIALKFAAGGDTPKVEARTADSGHILCTLKNCEGSIGKWALGRKQLRLGNGAPDFFLSTQGAPIVIGTATN